MNILLIAYSFPPLSDPQSIRWFYLSNLLAEMGYDIDVLTVKLPRNFMDVNNFKLHKNINVFRVFSGPVEYLSFLAKSKLGTDNIGNAKKRTRPSFVFLRYAYLFMKGGIDKLLIGGIQTEWLPFVFFKLKKIDLYKYDFVISSQLPMVDSLVGFFIKKSIRKIKWVLDIGDTSETPIYPKWRKPIDLKLEKYLIRHADAITLTNKYVLSKMSLKYGIKKEKMHIIRQGFDLERTKKVAKKIEHKTFRMVFTGTFYSDFRDPENLARALSILDFDFEFVIAGRNEQFLKLFEGVRKKVKFAGFVPHRDALNLQEQADLLIHLSNKQTYQIPGKFFEYLGSGNPILTISYNEDDETAKLTKQLNVGLVCSNEPHSIAQKLKRVYNLWKNGKLNKVFNLDPEDFKEFSWQKGAETLDKILKERS